MSEALAKEQREGERYGLVEDTIRRRPEGARASEQVRPVRQARAQGQVDGTDHGSEQDHASLCTMHGAYITRSRVRWQRREAPVGLTSTFGSFASRCVLTPPSFWRATRGETV